MPHVPGCRYDLFISYARENNRNDWVNRFKDALQQELEELLGRQFSREAVFFDKTGLRAGQAFPKELEEAAESSALLVPILSPSYLTSEWCNRERLAFFRKLPFGAESCECLAPVAVRPFEEGALTVLFRDAQRLSFVQPGQQEPWPTGSSEWDALLKSFAGQVMLALQQLRRKCRPAFLGRPPSERQDTRLMCENELQRRHFRVGPESMMVLDDEDLLKGALSQSALSIHFLGGAADSALRAIEIALEVCPGPTILYREPGAVLTSEEQLWLLEFERSPRLAEPGKYHDLQTGVQEFISFLTAELTALRPVASATSAEQAELGLICDQPDLSLIRLIRSEIEQRDRLKVAWPEFLETSSTAMERKRHWMSLVKTSGTLLFCWGETKSTSFLERIYAIAGASNPAAERTWYLTKPELDQKRLRYPAGICQAESFDYGALDPFLDPVRHRRAST